MLNAIFNKLSYNARNKKKLEAYKNTVNNIKNLSKDEFYFEYIKLKTQYKKQKIILNLFSYFVFLLFITSNRIFNLNFFVKPYNVRKLTIDYIQILIYLSMGVVIVFGFTLLFILIFKLKEYIHLYRNLLIFEELKIEKDKLYEE